jgi:hypothetical protein
MVRSPGRRSAGCGTAGVGASVSGSVRPPKMSLFGVLRRCAGSTRSRQIADICRSFSRCYRRREARSALRSEGKVGSFGSGPPETLNGPVNLVGSMTWIVRKAEVADIRAAQTARPPLLLEHDRCSTYSGPCLRDVAGCSRDHHATSSPSRALIDIRGVDQAMSQNRP